VSKEFEASVCNMLTADLVSLGYEAHGCSFVRRSEALRGTVWLVEGASSLKGYFMPRLSIGIDAIGPDIAVLSRDLHQLVDPQAPTRWYAWTGDAKATPRAKEALLRAGLPWIEQHLTLQGLVEALEYERDRPRAAQKTAWWRFGTPTPERTPPPVRLNVLQALSHAYELQRRYDTALDTWSNYIEGHGLLQEGTALERQLTERLRVLRAAANAHGAQ